ncbi:outer membrane autotransporter [Salmonella enterica subsp. enterica serovar Tallahassee str. 0012]|nr:outer membrane autotransporter [Salmonella enterica subsp. enterica serovar Tallahassee str. 0012]
MMVNTQEMTNGQAALNATGGSLNVANSAALYVADAKANQTYALARGFSDVNITGNG